ncbi:MAG TPA: hypothetical protein VGD64_05895 [Acidisarcina sp.]
MAQPPLALVPVDNAKDGGVKVAGAVEVSNGNAIIGSSGSVTAGNRTASVFLPGKGELRVCATTTVHLSRDRSAPAPPPASAMPVAPASLAGQGPSAQPGTRVQPKPQPQATGAVMIALDRGALEANFATGKYSDVLMTPDFRILISGPGLADVHVRVSPQGDTCVENRGDHAPYLTVSSQLEEGVYRVQPNQRVLFEHGSLHEVVDHEPEPCGCPAPALSVASAGNSPNAKSAPFPLAESEGLAPVPPPASQAGAAPGETQTQVTVPLTYNGAAPPPVPTNARVEASDVSPSTDAAATAISNNQPHNLPETSATTAKESSPPATANSAAQVASVSPAPDTRPTSAPDNPAVPEQKPTTPSNNLFYRIGRFFSRLFGK